MPTIILKKMLLGSRNGFATEGAKISLSMHGASVTPQLVEAINVKLCSMTTPAKSKPKQFQMNDAGPYYQFEIDLYYHQYLEEEALAMVLDAMEEQGWDFRFQCQSALYGVKTGSTALTKSRELILFHKKV